MLLATTQVISQYKWLYFQKRPHNLTDFQLFDEASRGPLGAFGFIVQKHWSASFASLAAIIVLASLLVDPFVQLVFAFPASRVVDARGQAELRKATSYDSGTSKLDFPFSKQAPQKSKRRY